VNLMSEWNEYVVENLGIDNLKLFKEKVN
jgi:hypothetical protein